MTSGEEIQESPYGVAKRLDVVAQWVTALAVKQGRSQLSVLDFGCGTGDQLAVPLARLGHAVLGVDMHAPSIADARARHDVPSLSFRTAEIDELVREDRRYDVVICSEVLEHIVEPAPFLARLHALTKAGGALIVTTPNGYGAYEWLCSLQRVFQRVGIHQALRWTVWKGRRGLARARGRAVPSRPLEYLTSDEAPGFLNVESGHVQFFSAARLERLFTDAGFRVDARRGRTFLCGPYVDVAFALFRSQARLYDLNNRAADVLPFQAAADWMFLLSPRG